MKIITYFSLIIFILSSFGLKGQSDYLLKAEGEIPKEFITSSSEKFKKEIERLDSKKKKKKKKIKKKEERSKKVFVRIRLCN